MGRIGMAVALLGIVLSSSSYTRSAPGMPESAPARGLTVSPDAVTAFIDVNVVPLDTSRVLAHQTVVVQGDRITALGPVAQVRVPDGATRVDGTGKYLMPGLADMHTHLAYSGVEYVERHLFLILAAGVTTVRNMDFIPPERVALPGATMLDGPALLRLKARVASGELLGPRIYTSGAWYVDSSKSVLDNVQAYKTAGYDHLKLYYEDSVTTDSLAAATRALGVRLVGHGFRLYEGGLARTLALGFQSIEHLVPYPDGIHFSVADTIQLPALIAMTVRAGIWNGLGPFDPRGMRLTPLEQHYLGAEQRVLGIETLDSTTLASPLSFWIYPSTEPAEHERRLIKALHDAGAKLLLGSDLPHPLLMAAPLHMGLPGSPIHRMLQTLVRAGLTPYQALVVGARNPAAYFGTLDSAGTVAVGKRADLVLLRGNPLDDIGRTADIAGVMAGGRWLAQAEIERRLDAFYKNVP